LQPDPSDTRVERVRGLWTGTVSLLALLAATPSAAAALTWSGTWSTSFGQMQLTQTGVTVSGTYTQDQGQISGTASGHILSGTWTEAPSRQPPTDAGALGFTLNSDLRSFSGYRRYGSSGESAPWSGTCTAGPCLANTGSGGPGGGATTHQDYRFWLSYVKRGTVRPVQPALGGAQACRAQRGTVSGKTTGAIRDGVLNNGGGDNKELPFANLPVNPPSCVGWGIPFTVIKTTLYVQPSQRTLTARVRINGFGNVLWGCAGGTQGTLRMVDSDVRGSNGRLADRFTLGAWNRRCLAHRHTLSNLTGEYVNVWIGCETSAGIGPRNCAPGTSTHTRP
jgi:hypothetical protein